MILSLVDVCSVYWYFVPFSSDKMAPEAQTNGPEEGMQLHGVYFSLVPNLFQLIK